MENLDDMTYKLEDVQPVHKLNEANEYSNDPRDAKDNTITTKNATNIAKIIVEASKEEYEMETEDTHKNTFETTDFNENDLFKRNDRIYTISNVMNEIMELRCEVESMKSIIINNMKKTIEELQNITNNIADAKPQPPTPYFITIPNDGNNDGHKPTIEEYLGINHETKEEETQSTSDDTTSSEDDETTDN